MAFHSLSNLSVRRSLSSILVALLVLLPAASAAAQEPLVDLSAEVSRGWALGEAIAVECLNRSTETGEHQMQENGELQYIPFWTCSETGRQLELAFGSEKDINCTIAEVDDPLFHILEFYIHNDAPLSCRIPSLPPASSGGKLGTTVEYTHLQVALTGMLQLSHLHINPQLNLILHTTEANVKKAPSSQDKERERQSKSKKKGGAGGSSEGPLRDNRKGAPEGRILAATAYSLPPTSASPKLVIGDALPLTLRVRWYSSSVLPPSTSRISSGLGGHVHLSTAAYCILSFGAGLAVSIAYFRGIDMPRRLRRYGAEKLGAGGGGSGGGAGGYGYAYVPGGFPGGNGGGGYGGGLGGKRD